MTWVGVVDRARLEAWRATVWLSQSYGKRCCWPELGSGGWDGGEGRMGKFEVGVMGHSGREEVYFLALTPGRWSLFIKALGWGRWDIDILDIYLRRVRGLRRDHILENWQLESWLFFLNPWGSFKYIPNISQNFIKNFTFSSYFLGFLIDPRMSIWRKGNLNGRLWHWKMRNYEVVLDF